MSTPALALTACAPAASCSTRAAASAAALAPPASASSAPLGWLPAPSHRAKRARSPVGTQEGRMHSNAAASAPSSSSPLWSLEDSHAHADSRKVQKYSEQHKAASAAAQAGAHGTTETHLHGFKHTLVHDSKLQQAARAMEMRNAQYAMLNPYPTPLQMGAIPALMPWASSIERPSSGGVLPTPAAAHGGVIAVGCFMLLAFAKDRDALFHILHAHFSLTDMGALAATCRFWRTALQQSRRLQLISRRTRTVTPRQLISLSLCTWARSLLIELHINMRPAGPAPTSASSAHNGAAAAAGNLLPAGAGSAASSEAIELTQAAGAGGDAEVTLDSVVVCLQRFPRLTRVGLQMRSNDAGRDEWHRAFEALPNIRMLHLLMAKSEVVAPAPVQGAAHQHMAAIQANFAAAFAGAAGGAAAAHGIQQAAAGVQMGGVPAMPAAQLAVPVAAMGAPAMGGPLAPAAPRPSAVSSALLELSALQHLETLIISNLAEAPSNLNFAALPTIPTLTQLSVTLAPNRHASSSDVHNSLFHCTPAQAACLGQCKKLSNLRCGAWSPPWYQTMAQRTAPRAMQLLEAGVGAMTRGKLASLKQSNAQLLAERALIQSSNDPLPVPSAAPLQSLHLGSTLISSRVWRYLSHHRWLTALTPLAWYSDLTPAQWGLLSTFKNLRSFSFNPLAEDAYGENPVTADMILPALLQCTLIHTLHLQSLDLSAQQLTDVCIRLPHLRHLSLRTLKLESVEPLRRAKKLEQLSLHFCQLIPPTPLKQSATTATLELMEDTAGSAAAAIASDSGESTQATSSASSAAAASASDAQSKPTPPQCFRASLPPLLSLRQLVLHERVRIMPDVAAPLNERLLARMPCLQLAHFHQNLLAPAHVAPAAAVDPVARVATPGPASPEQPPESDSHEEAEAAAAGSSSDSSASGSLRRSARVKAAQASSALGCALQVQGGGAGSGGVAPMRHGTSESHQRVHAAAAAAGVRLTA